MSIIRCWFYGYVFANQLQLFKTSPPFLDVLVKPFDDKLHMKVHVKPTNAGECLKANSECPDIN